MLRLLGALTWLRWRVTVNSLTQGRSRDAIERLSRITQHLWPLILAALLVPALAALGAGALFVGLMLAGEATESAGVIRVLRGVLFGLLAFTVGATAFIPGAVAVNSPRLQLLPVSRAALYLASTLGRLADLWIVAALAIVMCVPLGILWRGYVAWSGLALAAGLLLLTLLVGAGALVSFVTQWLLRNRRRAEVLALAVAVLLPLVAMTPMLLRLGDSAPSSMTRAERSSRNCHMVSTAAVVLPSELYVRAIRTADVRAATAPLAGLVGWTIGLHALGLLVFRRLLDAPASGGTSRSGRRRHPTIARLAGLPPDVSAVALAQYRLAVRTTRGRFILLMPVLGLLMLAGVFLADHPMFRLLAASGGPGLGAAGTLVTLLACMPVTMNQFAIAGAGLRRELLSPIRDERLMMGKAVGNVLVAAAPLLTCLMLAWLLTPVAPAELWMALALGVVAVLVTLAPVNAIISALFPCKADLTSIGKESNPHHFAALFGMAAILLAAAPPLALARLAVVSLEQPVLAPAFVAVWGVMAAFAARVLFRVAARIFAARRENLGLTA